MEKEVEKTRAFLLPSHYIYTFLHSVSLLLPSMADFNDDKPRFFKIILQTTIDNGSLMIPNSFSRKHCWKDDSSSISSHPTTVTLRTPIGLTWDVDILKTRPRRHNNDQPEVWIQGNAWEQFVSCHNLKQGHFVVFQYEGGSLFSIFVFDFSGSEIRYPSEMVEEAAAFQDVGVDDDDISVEIISKMEEENADQCDGDDVSVEIIPDLDAGTSSVLKSRKQRMGNADQSDVSVEILTDSESGSSRITPRKQSKKSDSWLNHPSFSVIIRPSYLRQLSITREFGRRHLMLENQILKLQVANCSNKEWLVKAYRLNGRDEMHLIGGWSKFVKSNSIQIDDVCEFVVIGVDENGLRVLQVSITRRKMK